MDKNPEFNEIRMIIERERAYVLSGHHPRVFYHPGRSSNVVISGSDTKVIAVPDGYRLDVDAWERNGRAGEAPLVSLNPLPDELLDASMVKSEVNNEGKVSIKKRKR